MQHVILITGTPCVGKTTVARQLAGRLGAFYINLTDYANSNGLILGEDVERCSFIVDEVKMRLSLVDTINRLDVSVVIDGHFAASVVPFEFSTCVFVLRRNPVELRQFMQKEGFFERKMCENLLAEILDVCFVEAVSVHGGKVCELDITGKTVDQVVDEVFAVVLSEKKSFSNDSAVDWLGFLEREGLTSKYLVGF